MILQYLYTSNPMRLANGKEKDPSKGQNKAKTKSTEKDKKYR